MNSVLIAEMFAKRVMPVDVEQFGHDDKLEQQRPRASSVRTVGKDFYDVAVVEPRRQ